MDESLSSFEKCSVRSSGNVVGGGGFASVQAQLTHEAVELEKLLSGLKLKAQVHSTGVDQASTNNNNTLNIPKNILPKLIRVNDDGFSKHGNDSNKQNGQHVQLPKEFMTPSSAHCSFDSNSSSPAIGISWF